MLSYKHIFVSLIMQSIGNFGFNPSDIIMDVDDFVKVKMIFGLQANVVPGKDEYRNIEIIGNLVTKEFGPSIETHLRDPKWLIDNGKPCASFTAMDNDKYKIEFAETVNFHDQQSFVKFSNLFVPILYLCVKEAVANRDYMIEYVMKEINKEDARTPESLMRMINKLTALANDLYR